MATSPKRKKRPSMAAVARRLAEIEARPTTNRELPEQVASVIETYNPVGIPDSTMEKVRPFLVEVITASELRGPESVRKHCNHLTKIACFAIERGEPLSIPTVMTTRFIDEYLRIAMAEESDHNRAERRRRLLALARATNPGPDAPAKLNAIGHSAIKPCYTPAEIAVIRRVASVQPTQTRSRDLSIVVALGAGAGLDSVDMRDLTTTDVEDLDLDGIRVHVHGPRPRVVVLRAPYEEMLRAAVGALKAGDLLLGKKQDRRNTAARATERAALYKVPHIEPARLRATWLADLMTDQIPLALILRAAGLKSARTISELQAHIGPWLEHKNLVTSDVVAMRGETR